MLCEILKSLLLMGVWHTPHLEFYNSFAMHMSTSAATIISRWSLCWITSKSYFPLNFSHMASHAYSSKYTLMVYAILSWSLLTCASKHRKVSLVLLIPVLQCLKAQFWGLDSYSSGSLFCLWDFNRRLPIFLLSDGPVMDFHRSVGGAPGLN